MDHRRLALLQWLHQVPDATGECDRCHADNVALWMLPQEIENEQQAHWMYCKSCFTTIVKRHTKE